MADGHHDGALGQVYTAPGTRQRWQLPTMPGPTATTPRWPRPATDIPRSASLSSRGTFPADAAAARRRCRHRLLGEWLGILGYPEVEALDISEGMLAKAEAKRIYSRLHCLALGTTLLSRPVPSAVSCRPASSPRATWVRRLWTSSSASVVRAERSC